MQSKSNDLEWNWERGPVKLEGKTLIGASVEEYIESRKRAQEKILLPSTFSLAWGMAMVVVGSMVI